MNSKVTEQDTLFQWKGIVELVNSKLEKIFGRFLLNSVKKIKTFEIAREIFKEILFLEHPVKSKLMSKSIFD